jgi:hypothetical protein
VTWEELFVWERDDWLVSGCAFVPGFVVWLLLAAFGRCDPVLTSGDGLALLYVAKTHYQIPVPNLFNSSGVEFHYSSEYFFGFLAPYPFLLQFLSKLCFGSWYAAAVILTVLTSLIASLLFKRMLIAYRFVTDPLFTTCCLTFFPFQSLATRSILCTDLIYLSCLFFAFIAHRAGRQIQLLWGVFVGSLFCEQSIVLAVSLGLSFFRFGHYRKARNVLLAWFAGIVPTMVLQHSFRAFFRSRFSSMFGFRVPFLTFAESVVGVAGLPKFHTFLLILIPAIIGSLKLIASSFTVVVFVASTFVYACMFDFGKIFRAIMPAEIFAVLIGLDFFINGSQGTSRVLMIGLVITSLTVTVSSLLVRSCSPDVLHELLNPK